MANVEAYTRAYVQEQWNQIEKEIVNLTFTAATEALKEVAHDVLKDYRDYTAYERDTGNLDESVIAVVFENGRIIPDGVIRATNRPADKEYEVKSDTAFIVERYQTMVRYSKGEKIRGYEESYAAARRYQKWQSWDGNKKRIEMVLFGEMPYRYALEAIPSMMDYFRFYEYNYKKNMDMYWRKIQAKIRMSKLAKKIKIERFAYS
jgi:hypothetical protein